MNLLDNKIIQSHKDYPNGTDIDLYVECQICSFRAKNLITHIKKQRETAKKEKKLSYGKMERMEVG
jgi:hypothetical protein